MSIEKHIYADSSEAMAEAKRDVKMDMSQQGNFVRLYEDGPFRTANGTNFRGESYYGYRVVFDFDVQVPYDTELVLKTVNHGDIQVKKTTGDYDIVLLDISMPGKNGLDVLSQLKVARPALPVLMLSMHPEEQYAVRALKTGASGYLTKESAPEEMLSAIRKVSSGGKYVSASLAETLASMLIEDDKRLPHEALSNR